MKATWRVIKGIVSNRQGKFSTEKCNSKNIDRMGSQIYLCGILPARHVPMFYLLQNKFLLRFLAGDSLTRKIILQVLVLFLNGFDIEFY